MSTRYENLIEAEKLRWRAMRLEYHEEQKIRNKVIFQPGIYWPHVIDWDLLDRSCSLTDEHAEVGYQHLDTGLIVNINGERKTWDFLDQSGKFSGPIDEEEVSYILKFVLATSKIRQKA